MNHWGTPDIQPPGQRGVVARVVQNSIVITGDKNQVLLHLGHGGLAFAPLSPEFRQRQRQQPTDTGFYDGTEPTWADIAQGRDANRRPYRDIWDFLVRPDLPAWRMALILGLAGEGKSTLLKRLAWDLAEAGYPVFYHHYGYIQESAPLPLSNQRPLVLMLDDVDQVDELPQLVQDLRMAGLPVRILAAARTHQWKKRDDLENRLQRSLILRTFPLYLQEEEVPALLEKLEAAGKLDRLGPLPKDQRIRVFWERARQAPLLEGQGQLLPALLTARSGQADFEHFIADVLNNIARWEKGEWLLQAYAYVAAVHRFGHGLPRRVLAQLMKVEEADLSPRFVRPLEGEVLALREQNDLLFTRHPVIAERAFHRLVAQGRIREPVDLYPQIFQALAPILRKQPQTPLRKLLTQAPLALSRQGRETQARKVFEAAARVAPENPVIWQAWALMEARVGNYHKARELFQKGTQAGPNHAPVWQAWALMEERLSNYHKARELFQKGIQADPSDAPTWQAWALMEKRLGNYPKARELFQKGTQADPTHAPVWQAWALMEARLGNHDKARELLEEGLRRVGEMRGRGLLLSTLGSLLAWQGFMDQAEACFREALTIYPQDPLTHYHFARDCLLPQGRTDEACEHLRRALALKPRKPRDRERIQRALSKANCRTADR